GDRLRKLAVIFYHEHPHSGSPCWWGSLAPANRRRLTFPSRKAGRTLSRKAGGILDSGGRQLPVGAGDLDAHQAGWRDAVRRGRAGGPWTIRQPTCRPGGCTPVARGVTAVQPAGPYNGGMFFFTYLARELRRRLRQAVFIALGLAVGVGLVVTVTAASAGVKNAQAGVLKGLYGVGTDITVTGAAPSASQAKPGSGSRVGIMMGPNGAQMCVNGKCRSLKDGYTIDTLASSSAARMNEKAPTETAALHGVAAAAGGLLLNDNRTTISQNPSPPTSFSVDGTDIGQQKLGPLSEAVTKTGRTFKPADANQNVAVVDANYATSNGLKTGGTITIGGAKFTIVGTVAQPEGSNPPNVYIPLARAQSL